MLLCSRILLGLWLNLFVFLLRSICDFRRLVVLWRHFRQCSICSIELCCNFFHRPASRNWKKNSRQRRMRDLRYAVVFSNVFAHLLGRAGYRVSGHFSVCFY